MKNQVFVSAAPKFKGQAENSLDVQTPLKEAGYETGLMLIILGGRKGVTEDAEMQYSNLALLKDGYGDAPIITMPNCFPIEEMDFLHNTEYAAEFIKRGIDFARGLPIGGRRILTHHLGTLVTREEFESKNYLAWWNEFNRTIRPQLEDIAQYAHDKEVEVKIETVPVPEFGDIPDSDERLYREVKLNQLLNPFYLSAMKGFEEVCSTGYGICLDLCHNRTIYEVAKEGDSEGVLHRSHLKSFEETQITLLDDVKALESLDLVHLNDGDGLYSSKRKTVFREGVPLGQGDISQLRRIINYLDANEIPYVLEFSELDAQGKADFVNRPGTRTSIKYLLE